MLPANLNGVPCSPLAKIHSLVTSRIQPTIRFSDFLGLLRNMGRTIKKVQNFLTVQCPYTQLGSGQHRPLACEPRPTTMCRFQRTGMLVLIHVPVCSHQWCWAGRMVRARVQGILRILVARVRIVGVMRALRRLWSQMNRLTMERPHCSNSMRYFCVTLTSIVNPKPRRRPRSQFRLGHLTLRPRPFYHGLHRGLAEKPRSRRRRTRSNHRFDP